MAETVETRIKRAITNITINEPFFTNVLLRQKRVKDSQTAKLLVNGDEIRVNPQYIESINDEQLFFDMLVATAHNVLEHPYRAAVIEEIKGELHLDLFNEAAGIAAINLIHEIHDDQDEPKYELPEGYVYRTEFKGWSCEKVYKALVEQAKNNGGQPPPPQPPSGDPGDSPGEGSGDGEGEGSEGQGEGQPPPEGGEQDNTQKGNQDSQTNTPSNAPCHIQSAAENDSPKTVSQQMAQNKLTIQQAATAAKAVGNMPSNLERIVELMKEPKLSVIEITRRFVLEQMRCGLDWSRPSRRATYGVYLPRHRSDSMVNNFIAYFDTSGSVTEDEIDQCLCEVFNVLEQISRAGAEPEVRAIYCDTRVGGEEMLRRGMKPKPVGGGGTAFSAAWKYIVDKGYYPNGILFFTDGYVSDIIGKYGREVLSRCPILWVLTERNETFEAYIKKNNFGETVRIRLN